MDKKYAEYLLDKNKKDYNLIAKHFSITRAVVREDIRIPAEYSKEGEKVLDLGCGNGVLFSVLKEKRVDYFGADVSKELIEIAKKRYPEAKFQVADALQLPFSDNFFDRIYSIGVLHHIPSRDFQKKFLLEANRVLKPGGEIVLRVWDFWKRKKGLALILKYAFLKIIGKSKLDFKDILYPWKDSSNKIVIERYFHCFTKKEIDKLFKEVGLEIEKSWKSGKGKISNIYIVARKQKSP